jgi:hypothetical protein
MSFCTLQSLLVVSGRGWLGASWGELEVEGFLVETLELGLERDGFLPAGEGVAFEAEMGGDISLLVPGDKESGGGELAGGKAGNWVRIVRFGVEGRFGNIWGDLGARGLRGGRGCSILEGRKR